MNYCVAAVDVTVKRLLDMSFKAFLYLIYAVKTIPVLFFG